MKSAAITVTADGAVDMIEVRLANVAAHAMRLRSTGEVKAWTVFVGRRFAGRIQAGEARTAVGLRGPAVAKVLRAIEAGRI
jgi:hypothetical protein